MSGLKFTEDHEWIRIEGNTGTVGISSHAQEQLGDVVFVELPDIGKTVNKGDEMAVVESVKAASEVYAPVGGKVTEINTRLVDEPGLVNASPTGDGWFVKLDLADASEADALMDEDAYAKFAEEQS